MTPEKRSLLVEGIELIVDQPQLLGVRHLVLLLDVRLPRLLDALAARHGDSMNLLQLRDKSDRAFLSRQTRKFRTDGNECVAAIELEYPARVLLPVNAILIVGCAHERGKSEIASGNFLSSPTSSCDPFFLPMSE